MGQAAHPLTTRPPSPDLIALQQRLGHAFTRIELLQRALTHRSFSANHYERLEFLGDAVLNLSVAHLLFDRLATQPEGDLSRTRANLVKQDTLHRLALTLNLPALLRLGEGELRSGGRQRPSILADALEAVLGAVYLDAGFEAARAVVWRLFEDIDTAPQTQAGARDPKTALQEWLQARRMALPRYEVVGVTGAEHQQTFQVMCRIDGVAAEQQGSGPSRRAAEQAAASAMQQWLSTQSQPAKLAARKPSTVTRTRTAP